MRSAVPAVGDRLTRLGGEHALTSEAKLIDRHVIEVFIARGGIAGHEPLVVRDIGQHHAGLKVAWTHPVGPRHPLGGKQRVLAGKQGGLAHGRGAVDNRDVDSPLPSEVAGKQTLIAD